MANTTKKTTTKKAAPAKSVKATKTTCAKSCKKTTKAAELKAQTQELVDLAIDKGTPILRDAAEEVRTKVVEVTKEVLKRLEKEDK